MPRQLRIEYPGAIYHVMSRGDHREDIFHDDVNRQDFLTWYLAAPPTVRLGCPGIQGQTAEKGGAVRAGICGGADAVGFRAV